MIVAKAAVSSTNNVSSNWDAIDVAALLPLVGIRHTTDEFGYLLRHYWLPSTELTYETLTEQKFPEHDVLRASSRIIRIPAKYDANWLLFREMTSKSAQNGIVRFSPDQSSEKLCEYNRFDQTFRTISGKERWPEADADARKQAFLFQPVLTPLLPIPLGFRWHVEGEDGEYMDFVLESKSLANGTPVLFVRRRGRFSLDTYFKNGTLIRQKFSVDREGLTAISLQRSVILEDRTHDKIRGISSGDLDTFTTQKLIQSRQVDLTLAPLFVKYQTDEGKKYFYDFGTARIIEIDDSVDEILDDYHLLRPEEIQEKHNSLGSETVSTALSELDTLYAKGYLADHHPTELSRLEVVYFEGNVYTLEDFWQKTAALLTLGVTERCNLNCSYCCYGGKFKEHRSHSNRSMSFEIAQKAIDSYLGNEVIGDGIYPISFYGGEPLLEFDLVRQIVEYAEVRSKSLGKQIHFSVTTNGTLLREQIIDYLVEHHFIILVSFDGPKQMHDRYRVFAGGAGSFDTVYGNLKRFVEKYPNYRDRGVNVVLAPPLALKETAEFVEELYPHFPISRVTLVNPGAEYRFGVSPSIPTQYGCHSAASCRRNVSSAEGFRDFSQSDENLLRELWINCVDLIQKHGLTRAKELAPFSVMLFDGQIDTFHRRTVRRQKSAQELFVPCFPGFTRRFCDINGNYRVCERVDNSSMFVLGNVFDGLDVDKLHKTLELRRHFGDCGNCTSLKTCDICFARMANCDGGDAGYDPLFDSQCQRTRLANLKQLRTYTEVMEKNLQAFQQPRAKEPSRLEKLQYGFEATQTPSDVIARLQGEALDFEAENT